MMSLKAILDNRLSIAAVEVPVLDESERGRKAEAIKLAILIFARFEQLRAASKFLNVDGKSISGPIFKDLTAPDYETLMEALSVLHESIHALSDILLGQYEEAFPQEYGTFVEAQKEAAKAQMAADFELFRQLGVTADDDFVH